MNGKDSWPVVTATGSYCCWSVLRLVPVAFAIAGLLGCWIAGLLDILTTEIGLASRYLCP